MRANDKHAAQEMLTKGNLACNYQTPRETGYYQLSRSSAKVTTKVTFITLD